MVMVIRHQVLLGLLLLLLLLMMMMMMRGLGFIKGGRKHRRSHS
jgi:hypothetical protein